MRRTPLPSCARTGAPPGHALAALWLLAPLLALATPSTHAATSSFNAELLGRTGALSQGVWGWHDGGREYALVCVKTGLSVVDVSDPQNPVEVALVPSLGTELRSVRTYENFALAFNQIGPIQVIDLDVPPESIRTVATYESENITGTHNAQVFGDYLYLSLWGVLPGDFRILDISDPLDIAEVGFYRHPMMEPLASIQPLLSIDHSGHESEVGLCTIPLFELERHHCCYAGGEGVAVMAHDCIVRGDTAYVAYGGGGWVALDITDRANPVELAIVTYPDPVSHSMGLTADGKYLLHADERPGGHMQVWDITDLSNVREMTFFETDPTHMIHNIYVDGNLAFLAYYTDGLRVLDISNPLEPIEIAFYDQHGGPPGSYFEGAYGAYPYTPDGSVYVTDVKKGLHVFQVDRSVRGGTVLGNVNELGTFAGLDSTVIEFLEIGKETLTDNTGFYRIGLPEGTHTMVTHHYGHLPDTSQITIYPGGISSEQRILEPAAFGPLRVEVRNSFDGRPLDRACLTIPGLPGGKRYSDYGGIVDWGMVPSGTYTGLLARWGSEAMNVTVEVPRAHPDLAVTKIIELSEDFEDFANFDQGWYLSAPDDDATDGFWVRDDPSASWSALPGAVAPGWDANTLPDGLAYHTGYQLPDQIQWLHDVDGGKVTLLSPRFDLRNVPDPLFLYRRWFSNDTWDYPGEDPFVVEISNDNGETWVVMEELYQSARNWTKITQRVSDYVVPTDEMRVRFVASDYGGDSVVEAAIDKIEVEAGATVDVGGPPAPRRFALGAPSPNPVQGRGTVFRYSLPAKVQSCRVDLIDVRGRRVETLFHGPRDGGVYTVDLRTSGSRERLAAGLYWVRLAADGQEAVEKLVVLGE